MKVLLFEWLTGGGLWSDPPPLDPSGQLLQQGNAMVSAVGFDLAKFAEVDLLLDRRLVPATTPSKPDSAPAVSLNGLAHLTRVHSIGSRDDLKTKLPSLAIDADAILLIAPETDGCLANSIRWLGDQQHKLISPSLEFVVATSNKNELANRLTQQGFDQIPRGSHLDSFLRLPREQQATWLPIVVKPAEGAGSEGIEYLATAVELDAWLARNSRDPAVQLADFRVEQFVAGTPASIAVVCRPGCETIFFPAMKQVLHRAPVGEYLRSDDCLSDSQKRRAKQLAVKVLQCLPNTQGFLGMDLVLVDEARESEQETNDVLIEINPRITMSYIQLSQQNSDGQIARWMLGGA